MNSAIYINIKKWLQMYGAGVLDYFIQPDHPEELDPRKRYDNFDVQFNQHVGTTEHFQLNQGAEFPFLAIDVSCDNSSKCFPRFYVTHLCLPLLVGYVLRTLLRVNLSTEKKCTVK